METLYEKKQRASDILMEYYAYCELRDYVRKDWEVEDLKYKKQCNFLYSRYETLHEEEEKRIKHSKSTRVARKLEEIKQGKDDYVEAVETTTLLKRIQKK